MIKPLGVLRNNPFNLEYNAKISHPGQLPPLPGSSFSRFATPQDGIHAGIADVRAKVYSDDLTTLALLIPKFAPPNENNTAAYIAFMAKKLGIGPDQRIDLSNAAACTAWAHAQIEQEVGLAPGGVDWYSDAQYLAAIQPFFPEVTA